MTPEEIKKTEESIRENAVAIANQIDKIIEVNPIAAAEVFKGIIEYLNDRCPVNKSGMWTLEELEKFGYLH